ncbi:BnaC08g04130D [Brassica napus]|uniref:BnaC08g04130D protein n=1 Tax=Brassica napus TaxID=3708 RepID=A0A078FXA8_BRANA|nr:BnaC08g04130D [Brassica napus]
MAPLPLIPNQTQSQTRLSSSDPKKKKSRKKQTPLPQTQTQTQTLKKKTVQSSSSSWSQIKNLLSCKQIEGPRVHEPSKITSSSCGSSLCKFSDVSYGNARVIHRSDHSPESSNLGQDAGLLTRKPVTRGSSSTVISNGCGAYTSYSSSKAMQFRKLSGCYECHMIVDPSRYPVSPRICACPQFSLFISFEKVKICVEKNTCFRVCPKKKTFGNQADIKILELGPEDSGRNIVDIIFKSSWLRKDSPIYNIERILKVHNTQRTIQRFEDCRDAVKSHAHASTRKEPRSAADGNELLRFQCTTVSCSLGSRGSTSLCSNFPGCRVCTIIRHGFHAKTLRLGGGANEIKGVRTTASSGRAHDASRCFDQRRAMLVCRVIAGRVRRVQSDAQEDENGSGSYDSVAGPAGVYTNLDDLVVFNPKAILPCFVVIYKVSEP